MRDSKQPKNEWDMPVSKAYYAKLTEKVNRVMIDLGYGAAYGQMMMEFFDLYLRTGDRPMRQWCDEYVLAVFCALRPEIDEAVRRSSLSRRRAAERRARKEAEMAAKNAEINEVEAVEEGGERIAVSDSDSISHAASGLPDQAQGDKMSVNCTRKAPWSRRRKSKRERCPGF